MISSGLASQTAISCSIWFRGHRESLPSGHGYGFSFGLPSTSRKLFPLTASIDGKDKDPLYSYKPSESKFPDRDLPMIEKTSEDDLATQLLKNVTTLDLPIIPNPSPSVTSKTSKNEKNLKSIATKIDQIQVFRYLLGTESAMKAILEKNTLIFVVDKRADKNIIKDSFKRMFKITAKKVNTSITPDGIKKAFVMLPSNCKALDLAKKIKVL